MIEGKHGACVKQMKEAWNLLWVNKSFVFASSMRCWWNLVKSFFLVGRVKIVLIHSAIFRSMNTRSTSSAWTKTAWCTPRSLWLNLAPTLCGRSSVCGCIAPSVAGPIPGSPGRSHDQQHNLNSVLHVLSTSFFHLWDLLFSLLILFKLFLFLSCSLPPSQGTKTMWQLIPLPTLASLN